MFTESNIEVMRSHMESNGLKPDEPIVIDGERHLYYVNFKHKLRQAYYTATEYPYFNNTLILLCNYGFIDGGPSYCYSSLQ